MLVSKAPDRCVYCKGDDPNCGFCEMGVPLDTQEDWDNTWGHAFNLAADIANRGIDGALARRDGLRNAQRQSEQPT